MFLISEVRCKPEDDEIKSIKREFADTVKVEGLFTLPDKDTLIFLKSISISIVSTMSAGSMTPKKPAVAPDGLHFTKA